MRARLKDHLVPMGQLAVAAVAGGALLATDAVAQSVACCTASTVQSCAGERSTQSPGP
jgi:hypothetical protein